MNIAILSRTIESCIDQERKEALFTLEEGVIYKAALGDAIAKLKLVKAYIVLVTRIASWYSLEGNKPFSQALQTGIVSIIKAAETFYNSQEDNFIDHVRKEIIRGITQGA